MAAAFLRERLLVKLHPNPLRDFSEACEYNARLFLTQARTTTHLLATPGPCGPEATFQKLLQLDFYIDTGWQVELHQRIYCFVCWINDVHQALVRADFKLVTARLVDVG